MKKYVRPLMDITVFTLNDTIATCPEETVDVDKLVYVHCLQTNKHGIFYDACEKLSGANYNTAASSIKTASDGSKYFVWSLHSGSDGEINCNNQCKECYENNPLFFEVAEDLGTGVMVHIAPVTPEVEKVVNSSI